MLPLQNSQEKNLTNLITSNKHAHSSKHCLQHLKYNDWKSQKVQRGGRLFLILRPCYPEGFIVTGELCLSCMMRLQINCHLNPPLCLQKVFFESTDIWQSKSRKWLIHTHTVQFKKGKKISIHKQEGMALHSLHELHRHLTYVCSPYAPHIPALR